MSSELQKRALRLLARREHTRAELARKLAGDATSAELGALLDQLEARKHLSEERYAETRARQLSRKFGALRVRRDLVAKGVAPELAARFAADAEKADLDRARAILERKYRTQANSPTERARRMCFLQSRGFSEHVIRRAVGPARPG